LEDIAKKVIQESKDARVKKELQDMIDAKTRAAKEKEKKEPC